MGSCWASRLKSAAQEEAESGRSVERRESFAPGVDKESTKHVIVRHFTNRAKSAIEYEHQNEDFYSAFEMPTYVQVEKFRVPQIIVE